jgi:hypothetical protein
VIRVRRWIPASDDVLHSSLYHVAASLVARDSVEPADTHIDLPTRFSVRPTPTSHSPAMKARPRRRGDAATRTPTFADTTIREP